MLHLRRLILSTGKRERSSGGIRKVRLSDRTSRLTPSVGAIFGATLKSVLDFTGVQPTKTETGTALRHLVRFLSPAAGAVPSVVGDDRLHLANGLGVHHVSGKQSRMLPECVEPQHRRSFLGRHGLKDIAFGATAAVLVAHYIMSASGADAATVAEGLNRCARRTDELLGQWPVAAGGSDGTAGWHMESLRAEARAIRRARAAAVAAASIAEAQHLNTQAALHLQLEWMRAAAWPRGVACDAATHATLCGELAAGRSVGDPDAELLPLPVMPLSALQSCGSAWLGSSRFGDSSEDGSSRSGSWASSAASSFGEAESGDRAGGEGDQGTAVVARLLSGL